MYLWPSPRDSRNESSSTFLALGLTGGDPVGATEAQPSPRPFRARLEADPERLEHLGCYALALVDEAEQDVLGPEVIVSGEARFF